MNITAIIILYNSSIQNSKTIISLLNINTNHINLHAIIWNNGPKHLTKQECKKYEAIFSAHNIQLSIYEDVHNIALSKIYNTFIARENFDFFTILDQDSVLSINFIQNIKKNANFDVIVPKIYSSGWRDKNNSLCYPIYNKTDKLLDKKIFTMGEIESISSGLTISNRLINHLVNTNKKIFNEQYALYAIDTTFFIDLRTLSNSQFKGICVGVINHSLDFNIQDRKKISPIRKLEMDYSKILNKIFYDKKNRFSIFLYLFRKFIKKEYSFLVYFKLMKCLIIKRHPRSCIKITINQLI